MGVIDSCYLAATGDSQSSLGKKVTIDRDEVSQLVEHLRTLGSELFASLTSAHPKQ
jgi:biotin operon repressor